MYSLNFDYIANSRLMGDNAVCYHPPSGSTHKINILSHDILSNLASSSTIQSLKATLSNLYPDNSEEELETAIINTLKFLEESDLITHNKRA